MRIEVAQISTDPGNIEQNTNKISATINRARKQAINLVIFPELAIPGYMSMDLVLYPEYVEANLKALDDIVKHTQNIAAIVGVIDQDEDNIGPDGTPTRYNCAAVIENGKLLGLADKTLLPNYDVFYEPRYFAPARKRQPYSIYGVKVGVEICEDLWDQNYPTKVTDDLVCQGAELLVNLSASPFYVGKRATREKLIRTMAQKYRRSFIYANTVGSQDGYDGQLVFDGQSMVFDQDGRLVQLGKAFEEDLLEIDLPNKKRGITCPSFNPTQELHQSLVLGIKEYFRRAGFRKAFIGLSGGIDSAVVAALAVDALGKEGVTGIGMPSRYSSQGSIDDAKQLAQNLGIHFSLVPIDSIFTTFQQSLAEEFQGLSIDVTEENLQARIRGAILMAEANKFGALVVSTGNKTETALGYTTLYGDMCGGLAAISDVSKLNVYQLADYINKKGGREIIPQNTITKPPSAELADNQTDEKGLGASYDIISPLVDEIVEGGKTFQELCLSYPAEIVRRTLHLITINEHKRRQAPPGIKVSPKAFGIGRRVPIAHQYKY